MNTHLKNILSALNSEDSFDDWPEKLTYSPSLGLGVLVYSIVVTIMLFVSMDKPDITPLAGSSELKKLAFENQRKLRESVDISAYVRDIDDLIIDAVENGKLKIQFVVKSKEWGSSISFFFFRDREKYYASNYIRKALADHYRALGFSYSPTAGSLGTTVDMSWYM